MREFRKLQSLTKEIENNYKTLKDLRDKFSSAGMSVKRRMSEDIIALERRVREQEKERRSIEKSIRNTENLLTK